MKNILVLIFVLIVSIGYSQTAEEWLLKAELAYNWGNYKVAIAEYTKAIELDPKNADAYYNRGLSKIKNKDINGGCLDFSKARELGDKEAYVMIKKYCNQKNSN